MKAGLFGWGNPHSPFHLATLQRLPEIDGVVVWGEDEAALAHVRGEQKVVAVTTDLDQVLACEDVFFVIATIRADMAPCVALRTLAAGKHALMEKPLGRTAADVEPVVLAAERAGLQLGVCYTQRYHPLVQEARRLIAQGVIGSLTSVEMRMLTTQVKFRMSGPFATSWLHQRRFSGGGIVAWLGCHDLDMMRFVTGDEVVSVAAEVATLSGEAIDVEDMASLALRFKSGALGSLQAGYTLAISGKGPLNRPNYDTYHAFNGQAGRIVLDLLSSPPRLKAESTTRAWESAPVQESVFHIADSPAYGGVAGEAFIRDFILAAQGQGPCPATGRDALQVARIVDAAYESSRLGCRMGIRLP